MLKSLLIVPALVTALLIPLVPAQAGTLLAHLGDTVRVTSNSSATNETATINFTHLPGGATSLSVYSAPELLSGTFGATNTAFSNLLFYCTDLYNYSSSSATYTVGYLTSSHQPSGTNDLTTTQLNNIATLIAANNTDKSATQLAIWSVEYGSAFSFSGTSSATATDVTNYLGALNGTAPGNLQLYQLHDNGVQGFAYVAPVPEPATLAVLATSLFGLSRVRRRRTA
jgi:hypothetical protein